MTETTSGTSLRRFTPSQWRVLGYLDDRHAQPMSTGLEVRTVMRTQGCDWDSMLDLARADVIQAGAPGHSVVLADCNEYIVKRTRGYLWVRITNNGRDTGRACPEIMVICSIGRGHRYTVEHVARSAGLSGSDVRTVLVSMQQSGLIECRNDTQTVDLAIFSSEIPRQLRLGVTRRGAAYLVRSSK